MSVIIKKKNVSETPGQMANKLKKELGLHKISYCGKLDPMSRGVMLFLSNEFCKKQESFLKLDKIYEFEILFGFQTDSYDILGIIENFDINFQLDLNSVIDYTQSLVGIHQQLFPPYSSITAVNKDGVRKPLWWWSKHNRLNEIKRPEKQIEIFSLEFLNSQETNFSEIYNIINKKINLLEGDFRQEQIKDIWNTYYSKYMDQQFHILKFRSHVSSGTYIRSIIQKIAHKFNTYAIAYDINRVQIGNYNNI